MLPDDVHQLVCTCPNCGDPMWLVHNIQTKAPRAWFCEPCYRWEPVRGEAAAILEPYWREYIDSDKQLIRLKHGAGLRPGVSEIYLRGQ